MAILAGLGRVLGRPEPIDTSKLALPGGRLRRRPQGGAGSLISGGLIDSLDHNEDTEGDLWYGQPGRVGIAQRMIRDAHVRQAFAARQAPLVGAMWDVEPASRSALDLEIADWIRFCLFEKIDFHRLIYLLTLAKRDGFSLIEFTDGARTIPPSRFPNHPGGSIGIVPTSMAQRAAWTIHRWRQSKRDPMQLAGVEQWIVGSDGEPAGFREINSTRLVRWTDNQEGAQFEGNATMRASYGPWRVKVPLTVLEAISHERHAGTPSIELPQEADQGDIDLAESILMEMRSHEKGFMILPFGYKFEWQTSDTKEVTAIGVTIGRTNHDIAHNMSVGFLLLGANAKVGSFALASTQRGQYEIQVDQDAADISSVINRGTDGWSLVDRFVGLNYGPDVPRPRVVARNLPTRDWSKILPIVNNLIMTGGIRSDDRLEGFMRSAMFLPVMDIDTARINAAQQGTPTQPENEPGDGDEGETDDDD